jgi:hypothetical protein
LNGITSQPNIMKIYQAVQKLLVGDIQTHTQTGDLISLLSFLESSLKYTLIFRSYFDDNKDKITVIRETKTTAHKTSLMFND